MSKVLNKVMLSMSTLVLATGLIIGGSYALFTDSATVNNHLVAGDLQVGLNRVSFQENALQADGTLKVSDADTTRVDLKTESAKLFNFVNAVPTSWQKAKIEVSNLGDVAFNYSVKFLFNENGDATPLALTFAEQIQIEVTNGSSLNKTFLLKDAESNAIDVGTILKGAAAQTFDIKATFLDVDTNNAAQTATVDFDMQVLATQKVN